MVSEEVSAVGDRQICPEDVKILDTRMSLPAHPLDASTSTLVQRDICDTALPCLFKWVSKRFPNTSYSSTDPSCNPNATNFVDAHAQVTSAVLRPNMPRENGGGISRGNVPTDAVVGIGDAEGLLDADTDADDKEGWDGEGDEVADAKGGVDISSSSLPRNETDAVRTGEAAAERGEATSDGGADMIAKRPPARGAHRAFCTGIGPKLVEIERVRA